jgi:TPR repeat protein
LLITGLAVAGPLEDATKAYDHGDYATAFRIFKPLAEEGNASTQYKLAFMYMRGESIPRDFAEGQKWIRKAAEQGNADAQYSLGMDYDIGHGVPKDFAEALKWFWKAAEQGNCMALRYFGRMYEQGDRVQKDYVLAYMWYRLAYMWNSLAVAALKGSEDISSMSYSCSQAYIDMDSLAKYMLAPAQIAAAQRMAREWKWKMEK